MATRLAEIYKSEKEKGGGLASTIGKRLGEKFDPRKAINQEGILPLILPFLKAYSATGQGRMKGRVTRAPKGIDSITQVEDTASIKVNSQVVQSLSTIFDKLSDIKADTKIIAKDISPTPMMHRDLNIIRQNIVKFVRSQKITPATKADMFFQKASEREQQYESKFGKPQSTSPTKSIAKESEKKDDSFFSKIFKNLGMIGVISGLVTAFALAIKEYFTNPEFKKVISDSLSPLFESMKNVMTEHWGKLAIGIAALFPLTTFRTLSAGLNLLSSIFMPGGTLMKILLGLGAILGISEVASSLKDREKERKKLQEKYKNGTIKPEEQNRLKELEATKPETETVNTGIAVGSAVTGAVAIKGATKIPGLVSKTSEAILDARTTTSGSIKNSVSNTKWTRFLKYVERVAPKLFNKIGVKLVQAGALMAIPIGGWFLAALQLGFAFWTAYELWGLWKEFNNIDESKDASQEKSTAPELATTATTAPELATTAPYVQDFSPSKTIAGTADEDINKGNRDRKLNLAARKAKKQNALLLEKAELEKLDPIDPDYIAQYSQSPAERIASINKILKNENAGIGGINAAPLTEPISGLAPVKTTGGINAAPLTKPISGLAPVKTTGGINAAPVKRTEQKKKTLLEFFTEAIRDLTNQLTTDPMGFLQTVAREGGEELFGKNAPIFNILKQKVPGAASALDSLGIRTSGLPGQSVSPSKSTLGSDTMSGMSYGTSGGTDRILNEISRVEGTTDEMAKSKGFQSGYDVTLGYGAYGDKLDKPLSKMTVGEVKKYQQSMLNDPKNKFNSSAVGKYQIVGTTLRDLQKKMGFQDSDIFSPELQDKMGIALLERRGLSDFQSGKISKEQFAEKLKPEWQGFERFGTKDLVSSLSGESATVLPKLAQSSVNSGSMLNDQSKTNIQSRIGVSGQAPIVIAPPPPVVPVTAPTAPPNPVTNAIPYDDYFLRGDIYMSKV